jgi:hypothetical protein
MTDKELINILNGFSYLFLAITIICLIDTIIRNFKNKH